MFAFLKRRRREALMNAPFPGDFEPIMKRRVPCDARLPAPMRTRLRAFANVFLAEKHFEGCRGLDLTNEHRVTVAAHACLLLLGLDRTDFYPGLGSVLVYPTAFIINRDDPDEAGVVDEEDDVLEGESWGIGTVIVSWEDVLTDTADFDGRNVLLHEFAHQLFENGDLHLSGAEAAAWEETFLEHYDAHCAAVDSNRATFLDPYGAEDPAEFFSVITEAFFERPKPLRRRHPRLYAALAQVYRQDPASFFP